MDIPVFRMLQADDATRPIPEPAVAQAGTNQQEFVQFLRVEKLKPNGIILKAAKHNLRNFKIDADSHIDPRRTPQNVIIRGASRAADVAAEATSLMDRAGIRPRTNRVQGIEVLVSLPANSGVNEMQYFRDFVAWCEAFFKVLILSAVAHFDEAAPHCHVILLPLIDGRMNGNKLLGHKPQFEAMQADFHSQVGQRHGLVRAKPAKRYSMAARASAADSVIRVLRRASNKLDDPAIRDALRDVLGETMPLRLMELLGVPEPVVKQKRPKSWIDIWIKNCPEGKH